MLGAHRLPGIAFEAAPTPAPDALPRMDIALFAGFAAMGPVHRPIPVEDFTGFRRIFGDACPLAFDAGKGEIVTAALAPSVRAFFANGGKRCWIVRLARTEELQALLQDGLPPSGDGIASAGEFKLPGLFALPQNGTLGPAVAQARSLGSWSDRLSVAARVERSPFTFLDLAPSPPARTGLVGATSEIELDRLIFKTSTALVRGDLVQFDDSLGTVYAAVESIDGPQVLASLLADVLPSSPPPESAPDSPPAESSPPDIIIFGGRVPQANARASRVTLELRVDDGSDRVSVAGIGLTPLHPRSWWTFVPDDLRPDDAAEPSLLVAATNDDLKAGDAPLAWLPVGLGGTFSPPATARHDGRTSLERDGLSQFDEQLFVDPVLAQVGSGRLMEEAERILHLEGRRLLGIHSVLGISEAGDFNPVSLLAVPDASQPGWNEREGFAAPDPVSSLSPPAHWFDHRGPCAVAPADAGIERDLDRSRFLDCATRVLPAPRFHPIEPRVRPPGPVDLSWGQVEPDLEYVLELARRSDFADAQIVCDGLGTSATVDLATEGFYYFRLRAHAGDEVSPRALLSLTVRASDWLMVTADAYRPTSLLSVQRALLRLASASGEMFALLSLPRHYLIADAVEHSRQLRLLGGAFDSGGRLGGNERRAPSFGALHHPWTILAPANSEALTVVPPEGAVTGVHARRTLQRGAWIAAANERLRDVVALEPSIADSDWAAADANCVNLLRRDPRGFLLLDSDTLSDEPEWRQINVRRLMSLLRRVALRRGAAYVFEPNGDVLRRAVERGFTELLDRLFSLGAFAGRKAEEAYRLAVSTRTQDRDAGRLVVEIGVAPAQPLRFLTIRLVQAGGRFAVIEEG